MGALTFRRSAAFDRRSVGGMLQTPSPAHIGWPARPAWRIGLPAALAAAAIAAVLPAALTRPAGGAACAATGTAAGAHDVAVTALPGVDLGAAAAVQGVSASSGPFPGTATALTRGGKERGAWVEARPAGDPVFFPRPGRRGGVVVERGLARPLGLAPGRSVTVATTSGPRRMRVAAVADASGSAAYVLPADLRRVAPSARVHGSRLLLRLADPGRSAPLAGRIARAYPGPQVRIARVSRECKPY